MGEAYPSEERLNAAVSAAAAADSAVSAARQRAKRARLRLFFPKHGIATWALILVVGGALALVVAIIAIIFFSATPPVLLALIAASFSALGIPIWRLLRDELGETSENRVEIRSKALLNAEINLSSAIAGLAHTMESLEEIKRHRASVEAIRADEAARLLAVDPGRLYPDEFENYVAQIFKHLGYVTNQTGGTGDQGVDVLAEKPGRRIAIQAKRYDGGVGNAAVQQVFAGMAHHKCQRCVVVSTSHFSRGAVELAQSTGCVLVGRDEIPALVRGELGF